MVSDIDSEIVAIAEDALSCIDSIATGAENALQNYEGLSPSLFSAINTFTHQEEVNELSKINYTKFIGLQKLAVEPVISRVTVEGEDGNRTTYFISRVSPNETGGRRVASYRTPIGSLASQPVGSVVTIPSGEEVEVIDLVRLHPKKLHENWDSVQNVYESLESSPYTISSFLSLLSPAVLPDDQDVSPLDKQLAEEALQDVITMGIKRGVVTHMALRDQPILDQYQDEIFRLPLDSQLFLAGPPGTGKTTTLIRRLGQKLDHDALTDEEKRLIKSVDDAARLPHSQSWIMFTPTELLKLYVKDAFSHEQIPASGDHIKTWNEYRQNLARNVFNILKSTSGGGTFIFKKDINFLSEGTLLKSKDWYEDYTNFFHQKTASGLLDTAKSLSEHTQTEVAEIGSRIVESLKKSASQITIKEIRQIDKLAPKIREQVAKYNEQTEKIVTQSLNILLHEDDSFLDEFRAQAAHVISETEASYDDVEDSDLDEEGSIDASTIGKISRTMAVLVYTGVLRSLARAKVSRRKIDPKSRNGQLASWLDTRVPSDQTLESFGGALFTQTQLRRLQNPYSILVQPSRLSARYREFRSLRQKEGQWYVAEGFRTNEISEHELDLILLLLFRNSAGLFRSFSSLEVKEKTSSGALARVSETYRNQVLVDEATDFSAVQLAIMSELSHPNIQSFFMCGDFNQRLTSFGIHSQDQIKWVHPGIERRPISVSYRQSKHLVDFAKEIAILEGGEAVDIVLPDRVDIEGLPPVLLEDGEDLESLSQWLANRIIEIEKLVGKEVPSIGILVNSEHMVRPVAKALGDKLVDQNLNVVACNEGQFVGNDRDVRVFDIQHIKGLEFEAVFFIGVDELIENHPDLYSKYIYVGATRAATYLGLTCNAKLPSQLQPLRDRFTEFWPS